MMRKRNPTVQGWARIVLIGTVCLVVGYATACWSLFESEAAPARQTIALSWGDGTNGQKAFYGAHVFVVPKGEGLSVRLVVYIGRPDKWMYYNGDYGEIGTASSWQDAVSRFSTVRWTKDALKVGTGAPGDYSVARSNIESHR